MRKSFFSFHGVCCAASRYPSYGGVGSGGNTKTALKVKDQGQRSAKSNELMQPTYRELISVVAVWQDATQREPVDLSVRRPTPPCQPKHTVSTDVTLTLSRQSSPTHHELFTTRDVNWSQPTFVPGNRNNTSVFSIRGTNECRRSEKAGV